MGSGRVIRTGSGVCLPLIENIGQLSLVSTHVNCGKKKNGKKEEMSRVFGGRKALMAGGGGLERDAGGSAGGWVLIASKNKKGKK